MTPDVTLASFVSLTLIITGLTISVVLSLFADLNNRSNKILLAAMMSITASVAVGFIIETSLILDLPHFYRTREIAGLISYPLAFFYVRSVVLRTGLQPSDFIHAAPVCLYIIDFMPFFVLSGHDKLQLIMADFYDYYKVNDFDEGWLTPAGFHFYFNYAVMMFYLFLQFRLLFLFYSRTTRAITWRRLQSRSWLTYYIVFQIAGLAPLFIRPSDAHDQWLLAIASTGVLILVTTAFLFLRPGILYGLNFVTTLNQRARSKRVTEEKRSGAASYPTLFEQDFSKRLHDYMSNSKKYLQHRYTINNLATELQVPPHQLSAFLNQQLNTSFSEFLNRFRIEYCIERIKKGDARRVTLEALASECGFNNRNSFTAAFKRATGITPSEFARDLA